jgi:hypothetical protein
MVFRSGRKIDDRNEIEKGFDLIYESNGDLNFVQPIPKTGSKGD